MFHTLLQTEKCQPPLIVRVPEVFQRGCLQLTVHIDIKLHEAIAKLILIKGLNAASLDLVNLKYLVN